MSLRDKRQHMRVEDYIYFDYKILEPDVFCSDNSVINDLLGQSGQRYLEITEYFKTIDEELTQLGQSLAPREPSIVHYLNLLNAKIDHVARQFLIGEKIQLRKVNISLGGMSFISKEKIKEHAFLKVIIYTKPKMIPIIINATVVYNQTLDAKSYRNSIQFKNLTKEQEHLLSQHIMLAQVPCKAD